MSLPTLTSMTSLLRIHASLSYPASIWYLLHLDHAMFHASISSYSDALLDILLQERYRERSTVPGGGSSRLKMRAGIPVITPVHQSGRSWQASAFSASFTGRRRCMQVAKCTSRTI